MISEDVRHTTSYSLPHFNVQKLVWSVGVRRGTKHTSDHKLGLREQSAKHSHEGDGASFTDVAVFLMEVGLRGLLYGFLQPVNQLRGLPAAGRLLCFKGHLGAIGRILKKLSKNKQKSLYVGYLLQEFLEGLESLLAINIGRNTKRELEGTVGTQYIS
jgi:hypothetical protein